MTICCGTKGSTLFFLQSVSEVDCSNPSPPPPPTPISSSIHPMSFCAADLSTCKGCCRTGVMQCASKAGTLLFLRLVFADEMAGSQRPLMALGAASLVGQGALTTPEQQQLALKQLRRRSSAVPQRFRRAAAEVAAGKSCSIKDQADLNLLLVVFQLRVRLKYSLKQSTEAFMSI